MLVMGLFAFSLGLDAQKLIGYAWGRPD